MTVVGVPARPIPQKANLEEGFKAYAVTPETGEDFREKTILGLSQEVAALRKALDALREEEEVSPPSRVKPKAARQASAKK